MAIKKEQVEAVEVKEVIEEVTETIKEVEATALQVVDTEMGVMAVVSAAPTAMDFFSGKSSNFFTSLVDDGSDASMVKLYNALNDNTANIKDVVNMPLKVTDIAVYPITLTSEETGEVIDTFRVVLICEDGKTYGGVGNGVIASIQKLMAVRKAPWNPALTVIPTFKNTRNGFQTVILRLGV